MNRAESVSHRFVCEYCGTEHWFTRMDKPRTCPKCGGELSLLPTRSKRQVAALSIQLLYRGLDGAAIKLCRRYGHEDLAAEIEEARKSGERLGYALCAALLALFGLLAYFIWWS